MKTTVITALAAAAIFASTVVFAQTAPPAATNAVPAVPMFVTKQPDGQWLASQFVGQAVTNKTGKNIGDINDLLFDKTGRISTAVIGVGGFLGMGEKSIAIPFGSLSFTADATGKRVVTIPYSKEQLQAAPSFQPTEKTVYMRATEQATELKDKAAQKIEDMRGGPVTK